MIFDHSTDTISPDDQAQVTIGGSGGLTVVGPTTSTTYTVTGATIPSTGIYLSAANTLAFSTSSTLRARIAGPEMTFLATTSGSAVVGAASSTGGAALRGVSTSGIAYIDLDGTPLNGSTDATVRLFRTSVSAASSSLDIHSPNTATVTARIRADGAILASAGTAGAPGFGILGDSDTGMFQPTSNTLAFSTGGTEWMRIASTGIITMPANVAATNTTTGTLVITGGLGASGSIYAAGFNGPLTGNASTATALQTPRTINGTSFDGTANITVTAAAGTLTGTTLNSTVTTSSLTSVGTLTGLTVNGTILHNSSGSYAISGFTANAFQNSGTTGDSGVTLSAFPGAATTASDIQFIKSRGGAGVNTVVVSGDNLGQIAFGGADGTAYIPAASIAVQVDGTPGTNDMPGRITFSTTADGAAAVTERMRIDSRGNIGVGTTSPSNFTGYTAVETDNVTNGGIFSVKKNGTVIGYVEGSSGLSVFANATDLKLKAGGAFNIQFQTNSLDRAQISSTGVVSMLANVAATNTTTGTLVVTGGVGVSGTVYAGGLTVTAGGSFDGNINLTGTGDQRVHITGTTDGSDTGRLLLASANSISSARGAYIILAGNEAASGPGNATIAAGSSGQIVMTGAVSMGTDLSVGGNLSITGSTTFNGIPILQTGPGSAQLEWRENDQTLPAGRWRWTADGDSFSLRHNTAVAGDFSTYANAILVSSTNTVTVPADFVVGGVLDLADGTAGAPSLAFTNDPNTGLFWSAADTLGITTAGTVAATFDASGNTNLAGGLGIRNGAPTAASSIVASFDRTVNGSTTGISNTVNLTNATLTADRNIYGQYNIVENAYQNAAAFTASVYGLRADARTSAVGGNSVNGEGTLIGVYGYANHQTADATYTRMENAYGVYGITQATGATALIDQAYGVYSIVRPTNAGATITNGYLFYGLNSTVTGTMTNRYGVYIASAINNYFAGGIQVGGTATGPSTAGGVGVGVAPPGDGDLTVAGIATINQRLSIATTGASFAASSGQGMAANFTPGTINDTSAAGTIANAPGVAIGAPTFTATNARTYTDAMALYIVGPAVGSTNVTATNVHALKVGSGRSFFPAGSATTPSIAIRDVNTGFYSSATDTLNIANNGALRFTFASNGDFTAVGNVTANSDRRIKKDIEPIRNALDKLKTLSGVTFTRIDTEQRGIGLIAQDVEQAFPEAVVVAEDELQTKSVAYGNLVGAVIEALKELDARLVAIEKRFSP